MSHVALRRGAARTVAAVWLATLLPAPALAVPLVWSEAETVFTGTTYELAGPLALKACAVADDQHLFWYNESADRLWYGRREAGDWSVEPVTAGVLTSSPIYSAALWVNVPIIAYYDPTQALLCSARGAGAGWVPEYIPGTADALAVRVANESSSNLHLLWLRQVGSSRMLTHVYRDGPSWRNETVAVLSSENPSRIDFAMDANDVPHAVWYDPQEDKILYGRRVGEFDWDIETVASSVDNCFWLDLEILGTSTAYVGYTEHDGASSIYLRSKRRGGLQWYTDLNVTDQGWLFGAAMAVAGNEGTATENRYFACGTGDGFIYYYRDGDEWHSAPIPPLAGFDLGNVFEMTWDQNSACVRLAFHGPNDRTISYFTGSEAGPTATPTPPGQPTPTPTPTAGGHGAELLISSTLVHPGDSFWLDLRLHNPYAAAPGVPLFVLLEVYGEFWFWPSWTHYAPPEATGIDYLLVTVPGGVSQDVIIEPFTWPDTGQQSAPGLYFHAAMLNQTLDALWGSADSVQWGYGP